MGSSEYWVGKQNLRDNDDQIWLANTKMWQKRKISNKIFYFTSGSLLAKPICSNQVSNFKNYKEFGLLWGLIVIFIFILLKIIGNSWTILYFYFLFF